MNFILMIIPIPFVYFYNLLNKNFEKHQEKNIALNSTALFHASSTVFISYLSIYHDLNVFFILINSGGYFIFDFLYIIKNRKFDILRLMYLYHHISVYLYIMLPADIHYWPQLMLVSELSNLPNYLVYYSIKNDKKMQIKKSYQTKILLKIQLFVYFVLRIFFIGYYGIKEIYNKNVDTIKLPIYLVSVLYLFGVIWFIAMLKQNI